MSRNKLRVKTGDTVKVIAGDDKGQSGKILSVNPEAQKVIVEGLNLVTKHVKPSAKNPNGGIIQKEAPIHVSNVMLLDPNGSTVVRTGKKRDSENKLTRYSKKTGEAI